MKVKNSLQWFCITGYAAENGISYFDNKKEESIINSLEIGDGLKNLFQEMKKNSDKDIWETECQLNFGAREMEVLKKYLQLAYDYWAKKGDYYNTNSCIVEMASFLGIEIKVRGSVVEEAYICAIHNLNMAHATHQRNVMLERMAQSGSSLTYEEVCKMDFLEYMGIDPQKRYYKESSIRGLSPKGNNFFW